VVHRPFKRGNPTLTDGTHNSVHQKPRWICAGARQSPSWGHREAGAENRSRSKVAETLIDITAVAKVDLRWRLLPQTLVPPPCGEGGTPQWKDEFYQVQYQTLLAFPEKKLVLALPQKEVSL
jgi:hypothetical protein